MVGKTHSPQASASCLLAPWKNIRIISASEIDSLSKRGEYNIYSETQMEGLQSVALPQGDSRRLVLEHGALGWIGLQCNWGSILPAQDRSWPMIGTPNGCGYLHPPSLLHGRSLCEFSESPREIFVNQKPGTRKDLFPHFFGLTKVQAFDKNHISGQVLEREQPGLAMATRKTCKRDVTPAATAGMCLIFLAMNFK